MLRTLLSDLITIWVVIDPLGCVPVFMYVTAGMTRDQALGVARRGVLAALAILVGAILLGPLVLEALGISIAAFQIAGGIVLFLVAVKMVMGASDSWSSPEPGRDPALFPIALPMIAGPGSMLAMIVLTDSHRFSVAEQARTAVALLIVLASQWLILAGAAAIQRRVGTGVIEILGRVMGLILAAFAVQTVINGLSTSFPR